MLKGKETFVVCVVGATGAVGTEMVGILEERKFPVSELRLLASERSAGGCLTFMGKEVPVKLLEQDSFSGVDLALFSAGEELSRKVAPAASAAGAIVIDNSAAWRMDPLVPLVVPEVNMEQAFHHQGIIANPNCSTIQLVVAIKPIHDANPIRRLTISTYQSVSGTGKEAMEELMEQTRALLSFQEPKSKVYPSQIAFNLLPEIGSFDETGNSSEELKLVHETQKIMGDASIRITATTVRVPVFRSHSESVNLELLERISAREVRAILSSASGVMVFDDPSRRIYPTPIDVAGTDQVFVGRIREDPTVEAGINLWIVADNLRKGAALNAIQIAEGLIKDR